jgi:nicotinate (nicotinamide) nucleotide adenylyltransferase
MNTWGSGRMQRWYLYGLSANPPTNAHYEIIKRISAIGDGDLTVFPSYKHPIKTNLIDFNHRVNMLHLLCDPLERTTVSTIESEYEVKSTYDLIVCLRSRVQLYEATKFIVVCDSFIMKDFLSLNRAHAEELLQSTDVDFCVILNNSNDIQQEEKNILEHPNNANKNISFLTINTIDESIRSTNARVDINNAQDLLPQCVFEYIQQNNISFI